MSTKMKKYTYALLFFGLLMGCNPEDLEVSDATPKFTAEFDINGVTRTFVAGDDDFYLIPSHQVENGVLVFQSSFLKDENCTGPCQESLSIKFSDYQEFNNSFDVTNSVVTGAYDYLKPDQFGVLNTFLQVINTSVSEGPVNLDWDLGGFDFQSIFQNVISLEVENPSDFLSLGLNISGEGCNSTVKKSYFNEGLTNYCDASIKIINTGGVIAATVEALGTGPFEVEWNDLNQDDLSGGLSTLR